MKNDVLFDGGALISSVIAGSSADKAGVKKGDFVVALNNTPIRTVDEYNSFFKSHQKEPFTMDVLRRIGLTKELRRITVEYDKR